MNGKFNPKFEEIQIIYLRLECIVPGVVWNYITGDRVYLLRFGLIPNSNDNKCIFLDFPFLV